MAERPVRVDAHLHLWQPDFSYPDPGGTAVSPTCDIPPTLLEGYMEEYDIDRAVIVQPVYPGEDNQFVVRCARANPQRYAVVCVIDPRLPSAARRLAIWVEHNGCRGLRLRPKVPDEAACFGAPETFPIWEYAAEAGVVISVLCDWEHLPIINQLAKRFPSVNIVVDHLAHPPSLRVDDCSDLLNLARHANVYLKVSGYAYYSRDRYPFADCVPLVKAVYEQFGPSRMIWGSDFPHILLQSGYGRTVKWIERSCDFLSAENQALVMGGNALRLYW